MRHWRLAPDAPSARFLGRRSSVPSRRRRATLSTRCASRSTTPARAPRSSRTRLRIYGLTAAQTEAILKRDLLKLLDEGGNAYYLAKFAGILGLNMQDIGALQTGMTVEQFKAKLLAARDN